MTKMYTTILVMFLLYMHASAFGQTITTIAGNGVAGYNGDSGTAISAQLHAPCHVTLDKLGNIYIADTYNNVIRKVHVGGAITTIAGTGMPGYSGDGYHATNAKLTGPTDVVIDDSYNIIIADNGNNVVRKIDPSGIITTIVGTGVPGYYGNGNVATNAKLSGAYAVTIDKSGSIFVSDVGNYVVRRIDPSGIITTFAGNGTFGDSGEGGPATDAKLKYPGFLAIHPKTGELYIPIDANQKVMKVNASGIITTVAGCGIVGNDGDNGPATVAKMKAPNGVCFDTAGNFYIGDNYAHVIRMVNSSGVISTVAGTGTGGYNGDWIPATSAQLNTPNTGAFDKWGNLYFADYSNHRVRRINYNTSAVYDLATPPTKVSIFPNPATTEIVLTATTTMKDVVITDMLGRQVLHSQPHNKEIALNIEQLPARIYVVRVNGVYSGRFTKE